MIFSLVFGTHHGIGQMPVLGTGGATSNNKEKPP